MIHYSRNTIFLIGSIFFEKERSSLKLFYIFINFTQIFIYFFFFLINSRDDFRRLNVNKYK